MRQVSRASVDDILWVRGFRDHTISTGYNLFKLLRCHFRAGAGPGAGAGARGEILSAFPQVPDALRGGKFPLVHRRRIRQSPTKLVVAALLRAENGCRTGLAGTLGHGGFLEGRRAYSQHTTILLLRKGKVRKSRRQPSRQDGILPRRGGISRYCVASTLSFLHNTGNSLLFALLVRYFDNHDRRRQTASPNTRGSSIPRDRPSKMEVRLLFGMRYQLPARLERQPRTLALASIGLRPNFTTALTLSGWPERRYRPGRLHGRDRGGANLLSLRDSGG